MVAGENFGESIILEFWQGKHWQIKSKPLANLVDLEFGWVSIGK